MSLSLPLDIEMKFITKSDRVKCIDFHPDKPWVVCAFYNGVVRIINCENEEIVHEFKACDVPVRSAKFLGTANPWIIIGSDDKRMRIFDYNTSAINKTFTAHSDYVRSIVVLNNATVITQNQYQHQYQVLTSSDDGLIKLWKNWSLQREFKGHTNYVMQIVLNPNDDKIFASASLDGTVKVWQLDLDVPNFTLEAHEKGVNCIDYYHGKDHPYLISGGNDGTVKIWDYEQKICVKKLEGHSQRIKAVCFHPELPILLTGCKDGTVRIYHSSTYDLITSLNYGFKRLWTISCQRGSRLVALGYDKGLIMIEVGYEKFKCE